MFASDPSHHPSFWHAACLGAGGDTAKHLWRRRAAPSHNSNTRDRLRRLAGFRSFQGGANEGA